MTDEQISMLPNVATSLVIFLVVGMLWAPALAQQRQEPLEQRPPQDHQATQQQRHQQELEQALMKERASLKQAEEQLQKGQELLRETEKRLADMQETSGDVAAVRAIAGIAAMTMETYESKFNYVLWVLGVIAALVSVFGFFGLRGMRNVEQRAEQALQETRGDYDKLKIEHESLLKELDAERKRMEEISKAGQISHNALAETLYAQVNIRMADEAGRAGAKKEEQRALRRAASRLRRIIYEMDPKQENILGWAYAPYGWVVLRLDGPDKACELMEEALRKGVQTAGVYYNAACYHAITEI